MKVLVTGASGFIGGWLVRRLRDEGLEVRVLRRKSSLQNADSLAGFETAWGDVTDADSLTSACRGIHSVFHLAGLVGYSKSQRNLMEKINVQGTKNMIAAATANNVVRFVHMSSVVAIGASFDGNEPLNENSPYNLERLNLGYFETKRKAESIVRAATAEGVLDSVIVNPSTVYGAGDAEKGSRKVQLKVARGRFPFFTSGGVNVIAVEDVVEAIVAAWKKGRAGERYILSGENLSIKSLFTLIAEAAGVRPPHIYLPNPAVRTIGRVGDLLESVGKKGPLNSESAWASILYHWFDNAKSKSELHLVPRPAKDAIFNSVQWMRERGMLS